MELNNLKKWLDLAQQYQTESFWKQIFDEKNTNSSTDPLINPFTKVQEYSLKCDLFEEDNKLVVEIEIPGINKEDVQVTLNEQILTITGEFKSFKPSRKYYLKERANNRFKKELTLPFPVLLTNSKSELLNGVLVISLPFNQKEIEDIPITFDEQTLK